MELRGRSRLAPSTAQFAVIVLSPKTNAEPLIQSQGVGGWKLSQQVVDQLDRVFASFVRGGEVGGIGGSDVDLAVPRVVSTGDGFEVLCPGSTEPEIQAAADRLLDLAA